jgi:hypothetical protein
MKSLLKKTMLSAGLVFLSFISINAAENKNKHTAKNLLVRQYTITDPNTALRLIGRINSDAFDKANVKILPNNEYFTIDIYTKKDSEDPAKSLFMVLTDKQYEILYDLAKQSN